MTLQTEFKFTLPHGYVDAEGNVHKDGVMRLATAFDEIAPMKDPRVQTNPGYLVDVQQINPKVIEGLFAADFAFLQDFYRRINVNGHARVGVSCPECDAKFEVEVNSPGE